MMKRKYGLLWITLLGTLLLASCSSNDHDNPTKSENDDDTSATEQKNDNEEDDSKTANHDKADQDTDKDNKKKDTKKDSKNNSATEATKNNSEKGNAATIMTDTLKMDDNKIKQPTRFPIDESDVISNLRDNQSSLYAINYKTDANENIATFTGTLYESKEAATKKLDQFMDSKAVPVPGGAQEDLGHGITGYGEGAAGHAYFSWEEGNWTMSIASLTKDEMDNPGIARKMVDYLEDHALPAPKDTGIVYVDYPEGGDQVNVDIRWQEGNMVYQLETNEVPLDALDMATSVK